MIRSTLNNGANGVAQVVDWLLDAGKRDPRLPAAASVHVLNLFGTVMGGYEMARAALAAKRRLDAGDGDPRVLQAKIATARFYAEQIMPRAASLVPIIVHGSQSVMSLDDDQF